MAPVYASQLKVPKPKIRPLSCGGLDYGSSLLKVSRLQIHESSPEEVIIELRVYTEENLDDALHFLEESMSACSQDHPSSQVTVTGLGIYKILDKVHAVLGRRNIKFVMEYDCNKLGMEFLCMALPVDVAFYRIEDYSLKEFITLSNEIEASVRSFNQSQTTGQYVVTESPWVGAMKKFNSILDNTHDHSSVYKQSSFDVLFSGYLPCLLTMFGSACTWTLVDRDGSMVLLDISSRCGVSVLGLGSILTGAKTFEELISLAEKGDNRQVDHFNADNLSQHPDDPYSNYAQNMLTLSFCKAQKKDLHEFRKEDLARSLLVTMINDAVQSTLFCGAMHGVKTIFIGGNVTNHPLVRHEVMKAVTTRKCLNAKCDADVYLLRHGGCLGALGALLS